MIQVSEWLDNFEFFPFLLATSVYKIYLKKKSLYSNFLKIATVMNLNLWICRLTRIWVNVQTFRGFWKHFVKSIDLYLDLDLQICVQINSFITRMYISWLYKLLQVFREHFAKSIDQYLDLDLEICVKINYRKELFTQSTFRRHK